MASSEPSDVSPAPRGVPSDLTQSSNSVSHLRRYVSLSGPNARMWMTAAYFSALLTQGLLAIVSTLLWEDYASFQPVDALSLCVSVALFIADIGSGSNSFLVRGLPQRITRQGVSADSDGIIVLQERKWWFPGEGTFIAWPEIRRVREVHVGGRRLTYFLEFALDTHRTDAELPSWAENAQA